MPNRWESSARPLFVKTVYINGNRHAILFEKDPLQRCTYKKTSRPNSSLSFASGLTISSSEESQNTNGGKNLGRSQKKNLSSELQSCLVKFKLASDNLKYKNKLGEENAKGKENTEQKRHKWSRERSERHCEEDNYQVMERKDGRDKNCYVYNLENYKRKKNYCFVKITSKPSQFILNCSCENDWKEIHNCEPRNKNNLVISASIQNLAMTSNENLTEKPLDYVSPFENSELHWNNYLARSYYNSLAERVFQWLTLTRKQKKSLKKLTVDSGTETGVERIYSGKKFAEEIKKNENSCKTPNRVSSCKKIAKAPSETSEEEIEERVIREQNVETFLSMENIKSYTQDKANFPESVMTTDNRSFDLNFLAESALTLSEESNPLVIKLTDNSLNVNELFLNSSSIETDSFEYNDGRKNKETHEKPDSSDKHPRCSYNKNLDKNVDNVNSRNLTEEFAERNQKSINNPNITRTKPVLIQNLSPQQHNKISSPEEEKIVWKKSAGRPQLHIFMPSVLLKDQSDDSTSDCETFLNL